jgi:isopentenyl-diphosphate delta-isomerase
MKIPIVDEDDNLLYYKELQERDLRKEITRTSALWVFNEKGEVLLAKRSKNKPNFPNIWGQSVAGCLDEDESYEDNATRETKEEIGVDLDKIITGPKERESDNHEFFSQYFFTHISSTTKFVLQEEEVDEVRWVSLKELEDWYSKNPEEFVPSFSSAFKVIKNYANQS